MSRETTEEVLLVGVGFSRVVVISRGVRAYECAVEIPFRLGETMEEPRSPQRLIFMRTADIVYLPHFGQIAVFMTRELTMTRFSDNGVPIISSKFDLSTLFMNHDIEIQRRSHVGTIRINE